MNRVAIFGATSAIAEAIARRMAAEGAEIVLISRRRDRLDEIARDLKARGAKSTTVIATDLADMAGHAATVEAAFDAFGGLDMVLVAYGTLPDQANAIADPTATVAAIGINFVSAAALLTLIANRMEPAHRGTIVIIGSVAGDRGRQSNYVYGSAKAGLAAFAGGLRHRLWRSGVRVVLVKPGLVDSPMTAGIPNKGALWAKPDRVAADVIRGMRRDRATIYTPWFWTLIMAIVRNTPDAIFRRTRF